MTQEKRFHEIINEHDQMMLEYMRAREHGEMVWGFDSLGVEPLTRSDDYAETAATLADTGDYAQLVKRVRASSCFHALSGKTQMLCDLSDSQSQMTDAAQNRQSRFDREVHSEIVAADARRLAVQLGLNADLAELIAISHDVGHTPGGHTGEHAMKKLAESSHYSVSTDQSVIERYAHIYDDLPIVTEEEKKNGAHGVTQEEIKKMAEKGEGFKHHLQGVVNLELEGIYLPDHVRHAIGMHGGDEMANRTTKPPTVLSTNNSPTSREGLLVQIADNTSSTLHDIRDMIETGLLSQADAEKNPTFCKALKAMGDVSVESLFNPATRDKALIAMREYMLNQVVKSSRIVVNDQGERVLDISMGDAATAEIFSLRDANYTVFQNVTDKETKAVLTYCHERIETQNQLVAENVKKCQERFWENPRQFEDLLEAKLNASFDRQVQANIFVPGTQEYNLEKTATGQRLTSFFDFQTVDGKVESEEAYFARIFTTIYTTCNDREINDFINPPGPPVRERKEQILRDIQAQRAKTRTAETGTAIGTATVTAVTDALDPKKNKEGVGK